jgi:aminoglycoside phosphotransferase (APT) family kinase protein
VRGVRGVMDDIIASDLIATQFPELTPTRVTWLGEGCDSTAFDVNGAWVFRFPKKAAVERQLEMERRLLPLLAKHVPVAVPQFQFHGQPSAQFGRRFVGYRKLPGEPAIRVRVEDLSFDALFRPLAAILSALHAFPVDVAAGAGVPEQRLGELIEEVRDDALDDLAQVADVDGDAALDRWRKYLENGVDCAGADAQVSLIHNDLAAEHILLDARTHAITGVIDWSDAAIGDPSTDFAGLFHWGGEAFARAVVNAYCGSPDERALNRARYLAACRGAMDVAFGLEFGRPHYVANGLRALRLNVPRS